MSFGAAGWLAAVSFGKQSKGEFKVASEPVRPEPGVLGWLAAGIAAAAPLIGNAWLFWLAVLASSAILWRAVTKKDARDTAIYRRTGIDPVPMEAPLNDIAIIHSAYALASYQPIIAAIASLSGAPLLQTYYLIAPAFVAFVSVFIVYRLLSELLTHRVMLAATIYVLILVCWGDLHRSPGNFAYVRLFQGKAVFLLAIAPLMLIYSIRVYRDANVFSSILLAVALAAGIGATQTTVLIGPLFLLMAAPLVLPRSFRLVTLASTDGIAVPRSITAITKDILFMLPVAIPLVLSLAILLMVRQKPQDMITHVFSSSAVAYTLDTGFRGLFASGSLLLLPYMVRADLRTPTATFVASTIVVGLSPPVGILLDWLNSAATWRITWVIPYAVAVTIALTRLADLGIWRAHRRERLAILALGLILFPVSGRTTLSRLDNNKIGWPRSKISKENEISLWTFGEEKVYPIVDGRVCLAVTRCY